MSDYDVIVIGGGPGGSKCAMNLGAAGLRVALIERDAVGGVCLNRGCIPSKTYLYMVELLEGIKKAKRHGIEVGEPAVNWEAARKRKDLNVKMLGMGLSKSLECKGVEVIKGEGHLTGEHEVTVTAEESGHVLTADKIVLAVGSRPLFLPIIPQGEHVISSTEILDLEAIPERLAIIGGGVTGVEMATVFSTLGTEVSLFEMQDRLLPAQDREVAEVLASSLKKRGVRFHLATKVLSCKDAGEGAEVVYEDESGEEELLSVDKALVVIGRTLNVDLQALAAVGIENDGRYVVLNEYLQTSLKHVYVLGDAAFRHLTAYGAEREGEMVADHIIEKGEAPWSIQYDHIPVTVFSHPEVGQMGLTEEQAVEKGMKVKVLRSDYAANAKAIIMSEREGMVKIIVEDDGFDRVRGVHIVGPHAADLIHQALIPVQQGMPVREWLEVVWSHPVLSEVLKAALEDCSG